MPPNSGPRVNSPCSLLDDLVACERRVSSTRSCPLPATDRCSASTARHARGCVGASAGRISSGQRFMTSTVSATTRMRPRDVRPACRGCPAKARPARPSSICSAKPRRAIARHRRDLDSGFYRAARYSPAGRAASLRISKSGSSGPRISRSARSSTSSRPARTPSRVGVTTMSGTIPIR
jgi:hypothetical protein